MPKAMSLNASPSCRKGSLLAVALKQSIGESTVEQVHEQAAKSELIIGERNGRRMATTREVLAEERNVIDYARQGRGACTPFAKQHDEFQRDG